MKKVAVYGATGSVGRQSLDVVRRCRDLLGVVLMSCHRDVDRLAEEANFFRPDRLVVTGAGADIRRLENALSYRPRIFTGPDAVSASLENLGADLVLNAVPGMAGLPLLAHCLREGLPTALANKESIVAGGEVIRRLWTRSGTAIYPVDSEHAAIYQCLGDSFDSSRASMLWLTASGGPFLHADEAQIQAATVEQALAHPTWSMGRKISVDSATMANKGLEVIEAHFLFAMPADRIRVVIQPDSIVHSMVAFRDTTVLAQLGHPDMRVPIERALLGPLADEEPVGRPLDFWELGSISFECPDLRRFPCLALAYEALGTGQTAVYCAADNAAAELFLDGKVRFGQIAQIIGNALRVFRGARPDSVQEIMELAAEVRRWADLCVK